MGTLFYFFVKVQICLHLYEVLQEDFRYEKLASNDPASRDLSYPHEQARDMKGLCSQGRHAKTPPTDSFQELHSCVLSFKTLQPLPTFLFY